MRKQLIVLFHFGSLEPFWGEKKLRQKGSRSLRQQVSGARSKSHLACGCFIHVVTYSQSGVRIHSCHLSIHESYILVNMTYHPTYPVVLCQLSLYHSNCQSSNYILKRAAVHDKRVFWTLFTQHSIEQNLGIKFASQWMFQKSPTCCSTNPGAWTTPLPLLALWTGPPPPTGTSPCASSAICLCEGFDSQLFQ